MLTEDATGIAEWTSLADAPLPIESSPVKTPAPSAEQAIAQLAVLLANVLPVEVNDTNVQIAPPLSRQNPPVHVALETAFPVRVDDVTVAEPSTETAPPWLVHVLAQPSLVADVAVFPENVLLAIEAFPSLV
jgi:hypothetical protein